MRFVFFVALLALLLGSCARRPAAQLPARALAIPPADSLAQLPPWLVPPPAGSTPAQAKQWQKAQQKALANATRPAGKVKVKNAGNSTYTLKQREKLNLYDRSKQQSKQKNDQRDQTQQKADLRHKEKPVTKTGLQLPAGFWIALALGLVGLIVWLLVRFTARSALR